MRVEVNINQGTTDGNARCTLGRLRSWLPDSAEKPPERRATWASIDLGDDPFALEEIMARLPAREFAARAAIILWTNLAVMRL